MVTPRKTTGTTRQAPTTQKQLDYEKAWRRRDFANRPVPPDAVPCEVCGLPVRPLGKGSHMRRHILDGDVPEPEGFVREDNQRKPERKPSGKKAPNPPREDRSARHQEVEKIAQLPYSEFIERLLA